MIKNDLKSELPLGWENMFNHREDWDPEGYSVGVFKLPKYERELVLARNDKTFDIMEYFFDDIPDIEISLDRLILFFAGRKNTANIKLKEYSISRHGKYKLLSDYYNNNIKSEYPVFHLYNKRIQIHRLIAFIYVPNPYPEKYTVVNHKNCDRFDFRKENLEWCDIKWNNQKENKKEYNYPRLYKRLSDGKIFDRDSLSKEYPTAKTNNIINNIVRSINKNSTYNKSKWELINPTLNEYLSKHPLRDEWYPHPVWKNVRANACGVLEVDGELRMGAKITRINNYIYYRIQVNGTRSNSKRTASHRIIAECFFGRLIKDDEVVDHIIPITKDDINNSIENLRICTQKENMNNELSRQASMKELTSYDLFGNYIKTYRSRLEFMKDVGLKSAPIEDTLAVTGKYLVDRGLSVEEKLNYIYYKWKLDEDGKTICIKAYYMLGPLSDNYNPINSPVKTLRKYLNTGMPAPDGFYYQQGDPKNMIYDPTNTKLEKKRPEIHWKDRDRN